MQHHWFLAKRWSEFFFFFFFGCPCGIWQFPGQGLNLSCDCDPCQSCGNTRSLTHSAGTPDLIFFGDIVDLQCCIIFRYTVK